MSFPITVRDDVEDSDGKELVLGLDPAATAGNDEAFGEERAPPLPPSPSSLVARLVDTDLNNGNGLEGFPSTGMPADIRQGSSSFGGTKAHEIRFLAPTEATEVTFSWDLPPGVSGTLQDRTAFGQGEVLDEEISGRGSATLTNLSVETVIVTLQYEFPDDLVASATKTVDAGGQVGFGDTGVGIDFTGTDGSGSVRVERFDAPPREEAIEAESISDYRWIIDAGDDLTFSDAEVRIGVGSAGGITDPAGVGMHRRSPPGSGSFSALAPTDVDESGTPGDISDDTLSATTGSFGEFVLASDTNELPVELARFDAAAADGSARLTWQTASETRSAGFEVQRQNEEQWTQVGYVKSKAEGGTTTEAKSYEYTVEALPVGTHQFRLRQIDLGGSTTLTGPVSVNIRMREAVKLKAPAPNPTSSTATLPFAVREQAETTIWLFDTLGQQVRAIYEGTPQAGEEQTARVDVSGLPSGTYFLHLQANGKTATRRVTVVR